MPSLKCIIVLGMRIHWIIATVGMERNELGMRDDNYLIIMSKSQLSIVADLVVIAKYLVVFKL